MKRIHYKFWMLGALPLVFFIATACAPNKSLARDTQVPAHNPPAQSEETFDYGDEAADSAYGDEVAPTVKSSRSARTADGTAKRQKTQNAAYADDENPRSGRQAKKQAGAYSDETDSAAAVSDDSAGSEEKYYQTGMASWYGREFQGKKTASGERFDMNDYTCAHRKLPFGTVLLVKNLDNGRTVKVRVNDRGPFKGDRILDLSYNAAKKVGMVAEGEAMIGITILKKGDGTRSDTQVEGVVGTDELRGDAPNVRSSRTSDSGINAGAAENDAYVLQAGAFYSERNAEELKARIERLTNKQVRVFLDNDLYKVRVEGIGTRKEAEQCKKALAGDKITAYMVKE